MNLGRNLLTEELLRAGEPGQSRAGPCRRKYEMGLCVFVTPLVVARVAQKLLQEHSGLGQTLDFPGLILEV